MRCRDLKNLLLQITPKSGVPKSNTLSQVISDNFNTEINFQNGKS